MTSTITFPILVIGAYDGWHEYDPNIKIVDTFLDEGSFYRLSEDQRPGSRVGALVFDSAGRRWRTLGCKRLGLIKSFWNWNRDARRYKVEFTLTEPSAYTLNELKDAICEAIQSYPNMWADNELMAGEAGEPRDEQELLDEQKAVVRKAKSLREILINVMDHDAEELP